MDTDGEEDPKPSKREVRALRKRGPLIAELAMEVEYQRSDVSSRASGIATRASILVAAASISTGLQAGQQGLWFTIAIGLSALAAIGGVIVLLPRLGGQIPVEETEADLWDGDAASNRRNFMYQKLYIIRRDEQSLKWRRVVLLAGYGALAAALVFAVIHLAVPHHEQEERIGRQEAPLHPSETADTTPCLEGGQRSRHDVREQATADAAAEEGLAPSLEPAACQP
jgi:hypothetical protein